MTSAYKCLRQHLTFALCCLCARRRTNPARLIGLAGAGYVTRSGGQSDCVCAQVMRRISVEEGRFPSAYGGTNSSSVYGEKVALPMRSSKRLGERRFHSLNLEQRPQMRISTLLTSRRFEHTLNAAPNRLLLCVCAPDARLERLA